LNNLMVYKDKIIEMMGKYAPKLLLAILTLLMGLWIIRTLVRLLEKGLRKSNVDESLHHFLKSGISILLKVLLLISVASMVGIQTTSFVALIGAASFAVGLALQGSLANFAGGILILLFKPFKVGDFIEAQGQTGTVRQIQVFSTKPLVAVAELGDSSVNFTVRAWCRPEDYWGLFFDIQEKVKLTFDAEGISIPFPQTDVHVFQA